jgi:hypothetical protein
MVVVVVVAVVVVALVVLYSCFCANNANKLF